MTPIEPAADTTRPQAPAWITDPDLIESIERGLIDIDDEFMGGPK